MAAPTGRGSTARFYAPTGVAVDGADSVYVADTFNNTIRKGFPARMILDSCFSGDQFRFDLTGPTGHFVVAEVSTDLVNWLPIWTNTFAGTLSFSVPQSGLYSIRFYRARVP